MESKIKSARSCLLICEDQLDQAIFRQALNDVSPKTELHYATNGFEAFFKLASEDIYPDYIFVELRMRFMDGADFLQKIKREEGYREIPVIIHSSSSESNRVNELKARGAWAIQFKPYEYVSLCNILTLYFGLGFSGVRQN